MDEDESTREYDEDHSRDEYMREPHSQPKQAIEAEVVTTQAVAVRPPSGVSTIGDLEQAFALAVRQRELLAEYIKNQLEPGKHFYEIKGQKKKSLTKEGAEIILLPHSLAPDYDIVSGPSEPVEGDKPYQITVKCTLRRKGDPQSFVGSGIGSAGSHKGTWKEGKWVYQPRQLDKYLCHNATLKMAEKSAMIAATINSTAASEFFTQDMEPENQPTPKAQAVPVKPEKIPPSQERCLAKFIKNLETEKLREQATQFLIDLAWLFPDAPMEKLELRFVPTTKEQYINFVKCLANWAVTGKVVKPYEPATVGQPGAPAPGKVEVPRDENMDPNSPDAPWRSFPVPFGKHAGNKLAELDKGILFGFWANFEVSDTFVGKDGKTRRVSDEKMAKDTKFRKMLDEAGKHYEFEKPEDK